METQANTVQVSIGDIQWHYEDTLATSRSRLGRCCPNQYDCRVDTLPFRFPVVRIRAKKDNRQCENTKSNRNESINNYTHPVS